MRSTPENLGEADLKPNTAEKRRTIVVCGPTASGKTDLADEFAERISDLSGAQTKTLVVDSMQVYREIPNITNQERRMPAELVGIISVDDEWNMARHRDAADEILDNTEGPFILDAGTGMYLNGMIMDIDISPKVSSQVREKATSEVNFAQAVNPRRSVREKELEISGYSGKGSIWTTSLRYDVFIIYLRPDKTTLDSAIERRSKKIARYGLEEAEYLVELEKQGVHLNPSVRTSIGVREMLGVAYGTLTIEEARMSIPSRTRKLARRQTRWFDKLARTLSEGSASVTIAAEREDIPVPDIVSDILGP